MAKKIVYEPLPPAEFQKELNGIRMQMELLKARSWAHFDAYSDRQQASKAGKAYEEKHDWLCDAINNIKTATGVK